MGLVRFGASIVNHQQRTYIIGGIVSDNILKASDEIYSFDYASVPRMVTKLLNLFNSNVPRPLLIGSTTVSTGDSLLIMGGSAVCFSFGTFWNKGCYTFLTRENQSAIDNNNLDSERPQEVWAYLRTNGPHTLKTNTTAIAATGQVAPSLTSVPRIKINSSNEFHQVLQAGVPVIIEGSNIGSCTTDWTADYLREKIGPGREVSSLRALLRPISNDSRSLSTKVQPRI